MLNIPFFIYNYFYHFIGRQTNKKYNFISKFMNILLNNLKGVYVCVLYELFFFFVYPPHMILLFPSLTKKKTRDAYIV